jgi:lysophospholipase L1-like esterase
MKKTKSLRLILAIFMATVLSFAALAQNTKGGGHWVTAWSSAMHAPFAFGGPASPIFDSRTVRMVVRPTIGGERARIRLSNEFGNTALPIGAVHIALVSQGDKIVPESDHALTFGGKGSLSIPPGAPMLSDPVDLKFPAFSEIAVSIWLSGSTGNVTTHLWAQHETYISESGDFSAKASIPNATVGTSWFWLSDLEVLISDQTAATLTLGDSITDGVGAKQGDYKDWPDLLANRLAAQKGVPAMAVVNTGIGGNRVLHDGAGVSALARFDRDVLARPGVVNLILLEGINDIGWPHIKIPPQQQGSAPSGSPFPKEFVSAQEIIAGYQQIIDRAHQHGIKVFGATLTPYEGADYYSTDGEAIRAAVNQWIRTSGAFDGVFDFDAAVRDPKSPTRFRDGYHSGDNLHPSATGYQAMAEVIDLSVLRGAKAAGKKK